MFTLFPSLLSFLSRSPTNLEPSSLPDVEQIEAQTATPILTPLRGQDLLGSAQRRARFKYLALIARSLSSVACAALVKELHEHHPGRILAVPGAIGWTLYISVSLLNNTLRWPNFRAHTTMSTVLLGILHAATLLLFYFSVEALPFLQAVIVFHFEFILYRCFQFISSTRKLTRKSVLGLLLGNFGILCTLTTVKTSPNFKLTLLNSPSGYLYAFLGFCAATISSCKGILMLRLQRTRSLDLLQWTASCFFWEGVLGSLTIFIAKAIHLTFHKEEKTNLLLSSLLHKFSFWLLVGIMLFSRCMAVYINLSTELDPYSPLWQTLEITAALVFSIWMFEDIPAVLAWTGIFLFIIGVVFIAMDKREAEGETEEDDVGGSTVLMTEADLLQSELLTY